MMPCSMATFPVSEEIRIELYRPELTQKKCRRVAKTDDFAGLVEEMVRLMRRRGAAGLAAPQVGVYVRLAVAESAGVVNVLVNPEIENLRGRDLLEAEGCLSLPPYREATARVWRSEIAFVKNATLENPDCGQVEEWRGNAARIVQHEIDHLDGVFFIDHCGAVGREIVLRRYKKYLEKRQLEMGLQLLGRSLGADQKVSGLAG